MIAYLEGRLTVKNPAHVVLDINGIGYQVFISLFTYEKIQSLERCKLHIHYHVREDAHLLYGFFEEAEKTVFTDLISVNGVGLNTARMILSTYSAKDVSSIIASSDVTALKKVKGIGPKVAQRIVLELRDKTILVEEMITKNATTGNRLGQEALGALVSLGFNKIVAEKAVQHVLSNHDEIENVEDLIKLSLKSL